MLPIRIKYYNTPIAWVVRFKGNIFVDKNKVNGVRETIVKDVWPYNRDAILKVAVKRVWGTEAAFSCTLKYITAHVVKNGFARTLSGTDVEYEIKRKVFK